MTGAASLSDLPVDDLPEVAFAGRSNVGKSSLINALVGQKDLARASNTPGRTQQLNFFDLDGRLMLVDLPGYGYARAPKGEVERWNILIDRFLRGRPVLRRACLLIDARHGLMKGDLETMSRLDKAAVVYQIVLTKIDKIKPAELTARIAGTVAEISKRPAAHPEVIATSAQTTAGIADLRAALAALAKPA